MTAITTQTDDLHTDTTYVLHGDTDLGTVRDEHGAITSRGRYVAWSQKGSGRHDGIVGFYDTKDEAVAAIAAAHGIAPRTEELEHCVSVLGGEVHAAAPGMATYDGVVLTYPLCRSQGRNQMLTKFRTTKAETTCCNCVARVARRQAYLAQH
ncbi:hypothetical protein [Streptomyces subrutilus]|uniref:hypothetical protein n=1 Tax=Streptomyces subrutilus TaxID=36818 RepID=UPI002E15B2B9|nr:hypothetical protein OG479_32870 [Streptomyces subrutilus]